MANWIDKGGGKYKLIAELGYDAKNKRIRRSMTITLDRKPRKGELDLEAAKFEEAVKTGDWVKPNLMGFEEFIVEWKKNHADIVMGDYTRKIYMYFINSRLIPAFGRYQIDKITTLQIVRFFADLKNPSARQDGKDKPLATNTVLNIYKALKSVFDIAHEWQMIAKNPMDGVRRPTPPKTEQREIKHRKKSYTHQEAENVITALYSEPENWRMYFIGVLLGGYRRGEYLGVEWSEVDFAHNRVLVEKQITFDEQGNSVEGELKAVEHEGFVPMPAWYMQELAAYKQKQLRERLKMHPWDWKGGDKDYVFRSKFGEKYYPNTPSLTWRKFLDKHNLPRIRLHDLRHTTAMLLRTYGADLKSIQSQLRHTKLATTTDIYMERDVQSAEGTNPFEVLNPKKPLGHQMDTTS